MNLLLVLLLPLQDRPIEASVEAFLKGDTAARAELVRAGTYAILPLQKAREKSPERSDALIQELKQAAAWPTPKDFEGKYQYDAVVTAHEEMELTDFQLRNFVEGGGFLLHLDLFDPARLKSTKVLLKGIRSTLQAVREICRQTGLDFGYFHGHIILGLPERLWPPGPPPAHAALAAEDLKRANGLVERLKDKAAEERDEAARELFKMGPAVIPFLTTQLDRKEADISARCSELLHKLRPRTGVFGPSMAARQCLDDAGKGVLRLADKEMPGGTLFFKNRVLSGVAKYLKSDFGLTVDMRSHSEKTITIRLRGRVIDFLSLLTQELNLDFAIKGDVIVVDSPEAIQKLVSEGK